jgi:hypothetical protein
VTFEPEENESGLYSYEAIAKYTPASGPFDDQRQWRGKDVILALRGGHFTLLEPDLTSPTPWSAYPIDDVVRAVTEFKTNLTAAGEETNLQIQEFVVGDLLGDDDEK